MQCIWTLCITQYGVLTSTHGLVSVLAMASGELNGLDSMHGVVRVLTVASGELNGSTPRMA